MSDSTGTAVITGEETGATHQQSGEEIITGETRTESPLDALYAEGALDSMPDSALKQTIINAKTGIGLEKSLDSIRAKATDKGFERPTDDAPEEIWNAFNERMPRLLGIPENIDDYKFEFPDDFWEDVKGFKPDSLREGTLERFRELGHKMNIPNDVAMQIVKAVVQEEMGAIGEHTTAQVARANELMGGENAFNEIAGALKEYAVESGMDIKQPAFRQADTWLLVKQNMELQDRIAELTGEERRVVGEPVDVSNIEAEIKKIQTDPVYLQGGPEATKLHDRMLELHRKKTQARK